MQKLDKIKVGTVPEQQVEVDPRSKTNNSGRTSSSRTSFIYNRVRVEIYYWRLYRRL